MEELLPGCGLCQLCGKVDSTPWHTIASSSRHNILYNNLKKYIEIVLKSIGALATALSDTFDLLKLYFYSPQLFIS